MTFRADVLLIGEPGQLRDCPECLASGLLDIRQCFGVVFTGKLDPCHGVALCMPSGFVLAVDFVTRLRQTIAVLFVVLRQGNRYIKVVVAFLRP